MSAITSTQPIQDDYLDPQNKIEMKKMKDHMRKRIIHHMKNTLGTEDINFTGKLTDSIHMVTENNVNMIVVDSPYGYIIEYGMAPGNKVNFDALKYWVSKKLGIPDENLMDVTYKIYNKILNKGLKPKWFIKKALKKFIGQSSVATVRAPRKPQGSKFARKFKKAMKKLNRKLTKAIKTISSTTKKGNKNLNKVNRYYKKMRRYK